MRKHLLLITAFLTGAISYAQTGGPDAFGYTYSNSTTPTVMFTWDEIDTLHGGTWSTASTQDDGNQSLIPIGFSFPFYGKTYDTVSIASNGTVYFADFYLGLSHNCLPGVPSYTFPTGKDTAFIAHFWNDLDPSSGGDIYYKAYADHFVIEYSGVVEFGGTDGDTWQIVLYANGDIYLNYLETSALQANSGYSSGIQGSPTMGLSYICDGAGDSMMDSLTVWFINPSNTGISTNQTEDLTIYPNPSHGQFTIANITSKEFEVKIIDNQGRIVFNNAYNNSNNNVQVNLSNIATGSYLMMMTTPKGVTTERIIIE